MSAIVFLLLAVGIATLGSSLVWLRNRQPTSMESGIDSFRREMRALSDAQDG